MNKILEIIKDNKKFIVFLVILLYLGCKTSKEEMKCDLGRPKFNYFFKNKNNRVLKYDLGKEIYYIKSIFDFDTNKSNYFSDARTLDKYIEMNDSKAKSASFIKLVNEILNSNRIWNYKQDYKVDGNTKISELRHIWLLDKLLSDLECDVDSKKIIMGIKEMLNTKPFRICSDNDVLKYCSYISSKPKLGNLSHNILQDEFDHLLRGEIRDEKEKSVEIKDFKLVSIESNIKNFGPNYYDKPLAIILSGLKQKFETQYLRKFNKMDRNDFAKLVMIYIPILQKMINIYHESKEKKKELGLKLNLNKKLFYLLKHQYKLISIYNLLNDMIKDPKEKENALKCCSSKSSNGKCFDFDSGTKSKVVVYGFNKYGYVKDSKCSPESKRKVLEDMKKSLILILESMPEFSSLKKDIKSKFFENMKKLLNYFLVNKITTDIRKLSIAKLIIILDKVKIDSIIPDKISTVPGYFYKVDIIVEAMIKSVQMASELSTIYTIANDNGLSYFDLFSLGNNIDKNKFAIIKLLEVRDLLKSYHVSDSILGESMKKVLGLDKLDIEFYKILINIGVQVRYHSSFLSNLTKILKDNKKITLRKMDETSIPYKVIIYSEQIFPNTKEKNVCKIYDPILTHLRRSRNINPAEYLDFKNTIDDLCGKRKNFLIKNKPLLFKDAQGRIREVGKKEVIDKNNKMVNLLVKKNTKNIVNVIDKKIVDTGLIIENSEVKDLKNSSSKEYTLSTMKNNILDETIVVANKLEIKDEVPGFIASENKYQNLLKTNEESKIMDEAIVTKKPEQNSIISKDFGDTVLQKNLFGF